MVLPDLGGRIHVGFDKVAGYDFFYRNNVIKPALVGLAGPWVATPVAVVVMAPALAWYERAYANAAARARARLG